MKNTIATDLLIKAHMNPEEMVNQEILWENHQIEEGVRKYQELMAEKSLDETTGGKRLLKSVIHQTISAMDKVYEEIDAKMGKTGKRGRDQVWNYLLPLVQADQAAIITVNVLLAYCENPKMSDAGYTTLCKKIAEGLRTQAMFENWKKVSKEESKGQLDKNGNPFKKTPAQMMIERNKGVVNRKAVYRWKKRFDNYLEVEWTENEKLNLGSKMLAIVCAASPDTFIYEQKMKQGKTLRTVCLSEAAWAEYQNTEDFAELQRPFLLPTLIKPVPYTFVEGKIEGGYHHIETTFFSRGLWAHTSANPNAASDKLLESVNAIQNTPWKINEFIFEVLGYVTKSGQDVKGVSYECNKTMPDRISQEAFSALSKEDKAAFKENLSELQGEIASERGKFCAFQRKLRIARLMLDHERFYFPHFSDFRTRLYPLPQELTPQGDKIAKALLQFADGKELGKTGLKWLMIHAANTYGMDKESLDNREQWVLDNMDMIHSVAEAPIFNRDWTKAEEPFGFLAVAKEISEAMQMADPSDFVSHIPCAQDGTVNGMQILSLMGRDSKGAIATNCVSGMERQDLYSEVASSVISILEQQATDCDISAEWFATLNGDAKLARKIVKQPVMTTPYGVTKKGMEDQINDLKKEWGGFISGTRAACSKVLAAAITVAMTKVNGKAVEIMQYLQSTALVLCEQNLPFSWMTPNGATITQAYNQTNEKRIQTVFGEIRLENEDKSLGLNAMRTANGSSPNVIHSFDASMLQMTVLKMLEAGHEDFAMIHDSYGVHACNTEALHVALREVALEIFGGNCLEELHEYVATQTDAELPEIPMLGDYDVTEILNAPYFFS
tara:strand:+ start:46 stop:2559 length:2514 start_codon:yes stop_codon:yes gene_type:complete